MMHSTLAARTSRFTRTARRSEAFESLEDRRLLSADNPVVALDWHGQSVKAEAGEYILALDPGARLVSGREGQGQVAAVQRAVDGRVQGVTVAEYLGQRGEFRLDAPQDLTFEQVRASVQSLKGFQYLEPNFVFQLEATPNDPLAGYEYALNNTGTTPLGASKADADMDAFEAWDVTTGSSDVVVGVVDSGVDYTHPDLAANMWHNPFETPGDGVDNDGNGYVDDVYGINAVADNGNPMDDHGHGTHTAGTIAAVGNNGVGTTGVSWNSKIMALKFLDASGSGSTADAIQCLNYAVSMRQKGVNIRLTSNSWGGGGFEQALQDAITRTANAGMMFVVAAGNGGADGVGDNNDVYASYPSNYNVSNVVAVAATDRYDALASFSNYGRTQVDLAAPGVDVASTALGGGYVYMSGTSMATPQVAGVAALAWSLKPEATVAQVRSALFAGVDKLSNLSGKVATGGRVNALGTLRALGNTVSGAVYNDADGDGTRGGAEAALAGRTVFLDANNNGSLDAGELTRTTDANGAYSFGALVPGAYTVRQVVPAGWVATAPAAGSYTVQMVDGQNFAGNDFGSRAAPADTNDPNDQLAEAFALSVGTAATGAIGDGYSGATDVDTFSFTVVAGQRVGFDLDADGVAWDSYLRVFNGSGTQLAANDDGAAPGETLGADSYVEYTFASAGTYYVSVSGYGNSGYDPVTGDGDAAGSTGAYVISLVNRTVGSDTDDQLGEATVAAVGSTVTGQSISPAGDVDMYQFTVSAGQRVGFDIDRTAGSALDSYLRVFDGTGRQLAYNDNGAAPGEASSPASYVEVTFPTAGTYFVGVSGSPNRSYSPATGGADVSGRGGGYSLTLSEVPTAGAAATAVSVTRAPTTTRGVFSNVPVSVAEELAIGGNRDVFELL